MEKDAKYCGFPAPFERVTAENATGDGLRNPDRGNAAHGVIGHCVSQITESPDQAA
jgi:hypothetical protein